MGSICSPENVDHSQMKNSNQRPAKSTTKEDPSVSREPSISAGLAYDVNNLDFDSVTRESLGQPLNPNLHTNTSRSGLKEAQKELGIKVEGATKAPFQIVVSPPNKEQSDKPYQSGSKPSDTESEGGNESPSKPMDCTLGGQISWKKVADFSALLPRDVKLKLWNGVFKSQKDTDQPEVKRIAKLLRTVVMLQQTREYKKTKAPVPKDIKDNLPAAVKEPSRFIASFLKKNEKALNDELTAIYQTLSQRFVTTDPSKQAKYAKKAKLTENNYQELRQPTLRTQFNKDDFLKTAFLQYMLYAFQKEFDSSFD